MADIDIDGDGKREKLHGALVDLLEQAFTAGMSAASFNNMPWESGQAADEAIGQMGRLGCPPCHVKRSMVYLGELVRELQSEVRNLDISAARTLREIEGRIEQETD